MPFLGIESEILGVLSGRSLGSLFLSSTLRGVIGMGDFSVLARIMLSYDIFSLLRIILKDGDAFPYLIESCSYLFSLLRSVRDRRSFPTCLNYLIIYIPSPRPSSTYLPNLLKTTFIIDRRTTSFIIHLYCLQCQRQSQRYSYFYCLSTFSTDIKDYEHRVQRLSTNTFRSSPPFSKQTYIHIREP